jgi:hypothetical protein
VIVPVNVTGSSAWTDPTVIWSRSSATSTVLFEMHVVFCTSIVPVNPSGVASIT